MGNIDKDSDSLVNWEILEQARYAEKLRLQAKQDKRVELAGRMLIFAFFNEESCSQDIKVRDVAKHLRYFFSYSDLKEAKNRIITSMSLPLVEEEKSGEH